jgi:hypothetical protein
MEWACTSWTQNGTFKPMHSSKFHIGSRQTRKIGDFLINFPYILFLLIFSSYFHITFDKGNRLLFETTLGHKLDGMINVKKKGYKILFNFYFKKKDRIKILVIFFPVMTISESKIIKSPLGLYICIFIRS